MRSGDTHAGVTVRVAWAAVQLGGLAIALTAWSAQNAGLIWPGRPEVAFREPPSISSRGGVLPVTLTAARSSIEIGRASCRERV